MCFCSVWSPPGLWALCPSTRDPLVVHTLFQSFPCWEGHVLCGWFDSNGEKPRSYSVLSSGEIPAFLGEPEQWQLIYLRRACEPKANIVLSMGSGLGMQPSAPSLQQAKPLLPLLPSFLHSVSASHVFSPFRHSLTLRLGPLHPHPA